MEAIHRFVDADSLMSIMSLPEAFMNRKLEVIILPADEQIPVEQSEDIPAIVESLIGAIPHTDLSLNVLREERLEKKVLL